MTFTPHRRAVLAGLAALPAACATARPGAAATLKVATLNIWHDQHDWPARLPLVVDALRRVDADVVGLQEVLQDAAKGLPNQAATLAEALGYRMVFVSTDAEGAPRRYGNAILSRLPIVAEDWKTLEPLDDYRTAVRVRLTAGRTPIEVVNTHLHHTAEGAPIRARQVADLLAWIGQGASPLVVMGDFNAGLEDPGLGAFTGGRFVSALPRFAARTTLNPAHGHAERVIDHIFAEATAFEPVSASVFAAEPVHGVWPSDHFGVAATLVLRPGAA
jgi:endonuclease/exonuclease/phosphatase family metal-dependent hydrolase